MAPAPAPSASARRKANASMRGDAALQKLQQDRDPGQEIKKLITANVIKVVEEWAADGVVTLNSEGSPITVEMVRPLLDSGGAQPLEWFFARLTELSYAAEVDPIIGDEEDTYKALYEYYVEFFARCVKEGFSEEELEAYFTSHGLESVTTKATKIAACRVSICSGLPSGGDALFGVYQGKVIYHHFGIDRNVQMEVLPQTDSTWKLAGHRGCIFLVADSGSGKDTVILLIREMDKHCTNADAELKESPAMNVLVVGRPTYSGLLAALEKGKTEDGTCCLMWLNSEVKACLGEGINEEHLCQGAEGTHIGKRTMEKDVCLTPNLWFSGVQSEVYT